MTESLFFPEDVGVGWVLRLGLPSYCYSRGVTEGDEVECEIPARYSSCRCIGCPWALHTSDTQTIMERIVLQC